MDRTFHLDGLARAAALALCAVPVALPALAADAGPAGGGVLMPAVGQYDSQQPHGSITLVPDGSVVGGRWVVRIVARNTGDVPARLQDADLSLATAAGVPAKQVPVDTLVQEARAAGAVKGAGTAYQQSAYSHNDNMAMRDSNGNIVGGNYGGAADGAPLEGRAAPLARAGADTPEVASQVSAIRAGVLQSLEVPPGKAAGSQFVVDHLKFGRKEPRTLVVTVRFNGDLHRIELPVPPEAR